MSIILQLRKNILDKDKGKASKLEEEWEKKIMKNRTKIWTRTYTEEIILKKKKSKHWLITNKKDNRGK